MFYYYSLFVHFQNLLFLFIIRIVTCVLLLCLVNYISILIMASFSSSANSFSLPDAISLTSTLVLAVCSPGKFLLLSISETKTLQFVGQ